MIKCGMQKTSWVGFFALLLLLCACQPGMRPNQSPARPSEPTGSPHPATTQEAASAAVSRLESAEYRVVERFEIANHGPGSPSKHNLWAALIRDLPPYQQVVEMTISGAKYQTFEDEYGNLIAEFDLKGIKPGDSMVLEIRYRVIVNQLTYDLSQCEGEAPKFFTTAERYVESDNPQIRSLAAQLSNGTTDPCQQTRAFYEYVAENLIYTDNGKDWGAQAALGEMGADCSEYSDLMIALSRAAGLPARYLEGLLVVGADTAALARREHAWLEVYLPQIGWTPMDPTLGRSLLLRDQYFATANLDHIIVTRGRKSSALRGGSYYSHIYWPGTSAEIQIEHFGWQITPQ